nr:MAG TPA: hypothetical protein [Caudoviricetes sp.]
MISHKRRLCVHLKFLYDDVFFFCHFYEELVIHIACSFTFPLLRLSLIYRGRLNLLVVGRTLSIEFRN